MLRRHSTRIEEAQMNHTRSKLKSAIGAMFLLLGIALTASAVDPDFPSLVKRTQGEKPTFAKRQQELLAQRYDLSNRPAKDAKMSRGKPVQEGVRVKLPAGMTWEKLAAMSPDEIKAQGAFPAGFLPLPHPHHESGGMIFPK